MGQKRTIKQNTDYCFCCGRPFSNYKEKSVYKLNPKKEHSVANTVVLCEDCLNEANIDKNILYENFSIKSICKRIELKKNAQLLSKHVKEIRKKNNVNKKPL